jgi:hypothetical protein
MGTDLYLSPEQAYELWQSGQVKEACKRDHNVVTLLDASGNALGNFVPDRLVMLGDSHCMIGFQKPEKDLNREG